MSLLKLYQDYNIEIATEGHKHSRPGWINVACPFCSGDNPGFHLGYNEEDNYFYCWRCGSHKKIPTIAKLLGVSSNETYRLVKEYGVGVESLGEERKISPKIRLKSHKLPSDVKRMGKNHRRYFEKRGYDPERIERNWGVLGTGPMSQLDGISYKYRILVPIDWNNQRVSFQTRDITNRQKLKYITCPKDRELIFHKHILYGKQEMWSKTGICVEGVFDVWRFGFNAFATFGIEYTFQQMRLISKLFDRVFIAFDPDKQAQKKANELRIELQFRGVECHNILLNCDPGDMKQKDADDLVKSILK
jgi:DNA primase